MNMSIFFYRLACRERVKKMSFEQKKRIAEQISEYSLREPIWRIHESKYTLKEFPNEQFTGLQIFAYFEEIMSQFGGDVNPERTKMVKLFERNTEKARGN